MEIIIALVSFAVGAVVAALIRRDHPIGDLRIDRSDPTSEPLLFLELDTDVRSIMRKKHVTFRVKLENFIPHK